MARRGPAEVVWANEASATTDVRIDCGSVVTLVESANSALVDLWQVKDALVRTTPGRRLLTCLPPTATTNGREKIRAIWMG